YEVPFTIGNASVQDLARALQRLLARANPEPIAPPSRPRRSLAEQMKILLRVLDEEWRSLADLVPRPFSRMDAVFAFLAVLELVRLGQAAVRVDGGEAVFARPEAETTP
ncbi:MAG: hypothetical protein WHU10_08415, partial [Fimbriimonadales bacterium]